MRGELLTIIYQFFAQFLGVHSDVYSYGFKDAFSSMFIYNDGYNDYTVQLLNNMMGYYEDFGDGIDFLQVPINFIAVILTFIVFIFLIILLFKLFKWIFNLIFKLFRLN